MSDELIGRSNSLLAELLSVVLDVDDDDRDIIRVIIAITNESAVPISKIESSIDTIGKGSYAAERSVSSIGPGLTRNFHFTLGEEPGHWVFNLSHGSDSSKETLEIGPIRADLRIGDTIEEEIELAGASIGGGVGGGMIADVFSEALDDFGKVRETIEIQMEFEGTPETSSRDAENEDKLEQIPPEISPPSLKPPSKSSSKSWDEVPESPPPKPSMTPPPKPSMTPLTKASTESSPPSSPPPDYSSDPLLSPDILAKISSTSSSGMTSKSEENARPPPPTQGNKVHEAPPTSAARIAPPINAHSESSPSVREAPPSGPPASAPPPSGPPSGPPASAPPPSGPPSGPPASAPPPSSGPSSGPPSGPPTSAPPKSAFKPPSSGPSNDTFKPPISGPPS